MAKKNNKPAPTNEAPPEIGQAETQAEAQAEPQAETATITTESIATEASATVEVTAPVEPVATEPAVEASAAETTPSTELAPAAEVASGTATLAGGFQSFLPSVEPGVMVTEERTAHGIPLPPPGEFNGYVSREPQIKSHDVATLKQLTGGLIAAGAEVGGKPVASAKDAISWLLDRVRASYESE